MSQKSPEELLEVCAWHFPGSKSPVSTLAIKSQKGNISVFAIHTYGLFHNYSPLLFKCELSLDSAPPRQAQSEWGCVPAERSGGVGARGVDLALRLEFANCCSNWGDFIRMNLNKPRESARLGNKPHCQCLCDGCGEGFEGLHPLPRCLLPCAVEEHCLGRWKTDL